MLKKLELRLRVLRSVTVYVASTGRSLSRYISRLVIFRSIPTILPALSSHTLTVKRALNCISSRYISLLSCNFRLKALTSSALYPVTIFAFVITVSGYVDFIVWFSINETRPVVTCLARPLFFPPQLQRPSGHVTSTHSFHSDPIHRMQRSEQRMWHRSQPTAEHSCESRPKCKDIIPREDPEEKTKEGRREDEGKSRDSNSEQRARRD